VISMNSCALITTGSCWGLPQQCPVLSGGRAQDCTAIGGSCATFCEAVKAEKPWFEQVANKCN